MTLRTWTARVLATSALAIRAQRTGALATGVALVCLALTSACGNGDSSGPGTATGGQANASGGSGGSVQGSGGDAGTGGAVFMGPVTRYSACAAYVESVCLREYECERGTQVTQCLSRGLEMCPDLLFSPGSTRTPEGVLECAETYLEFSCTELRAGRVPACATPGSREGDEACTFPSQCRSLHCEGGGFACGLCAAPVEPGGDCSRLGTSCLPGYECVSGSCEPREAEPPLMRGSVGDACSATEPCELALACLLDEPGGTVSTCGVPPTAGQPCAPGRFGYAVCASSAYCDADTMCRERPAVGQPCGVSPETGNSAICAAAAVCVEGTCQTAPGLGATCPSPSEDLLPFIAQGGCSTGLSCACSDDACTVGVCAQVARAGQPCDPPTTVCAMGSSCEGGWCEKALQGTFTDLCGE